MPSTDGAGANVTDDRSTREGAGPGMTPGPGNSAPTRAQAPPSAAAPEATVCHFELSAPRRFAYPVLLLLVAEEPMHGYRLVRSLRDLRYGSVSRPNVYRALADLELDGLLESWPEEPDAGSTRHVYGITPTGRLQLASWMETIAGERDVLDRVLERFTSWAEAEHTA